MTKKWNVSFPLGQIRSFFSKKFSNYRSKKKTKKKWNGMLDEEEVEFRERGMENSYSIDEAIEAIGFGRFQFLVMAYAGLGWAAEAMEIMLLSFVGAAVGSEWGISSRAEGFITSVVFCGMLIGAYSGGILSDRCGRRRGFLATAIVTFTAGFLSSLAPNYTCLIIVRGFVGIGLGGGPVLSSWFLEFIPAPNRGFWMVVLSAFWTFGTIFEASLASVVLPILGWRWLLALSSLPSFLLLVFYHLMPESPLYLYANGREEEAFRLLLSIAAINRSLLPPGGLRRRAADSEETQLLSGPGVAPVGPLPPAEPPSGSAVLLLSPELLRSTLLLWAVFFLNAFSYYGLVLLASQLSTGEAYCRPGLLHRAGPDEPPVKDVLVSSLAEIPGLILSATIVDRLGRKMSMAGMFFAGCFFLLPLTLHQPRMVTTGLLFGARICVSCTFTIVYIYAPEIYPTAIRTTGVGIASAMGRVGGILCPLAAVGLIRACLRAAAVLLFTLAVFLSALCTLFFPFDTKGRWLAI